MFFKKEKSVRGVKRKLSSKIKSGKPEKIQKKIILKETDSSESEYESDVEKFVPDVEEDDIETPQDKKLRLAKKYLQEIEIEEKARAEKRDFNESVISKRLNEDYLEQTGRLKRNLADCLDGFDENKVVLKCGVLKQTVTCLCLSRDNLYIYSGSKDAAIIKWSIKDKTKINSIQYKKNLSGSKFEGHSTTIMSIAISYDNLFLAVGDKSHDIQIYSGDDLRHLHTFQGHRGAVTGLVFRKDSHQLYSVSEDRLVKVWSVDELTYIETMFGHQNGITAIDASSKERAVTAAADTSIRLWKIAEESQLIFNGHTGSIDCVKLINEDYFVSGGQDGLLSVWGTMKKKPLCSIANAHGINTSTGISNENWLSCVSTVWNTDLIASGSGDGYIRLWKVGENYKCLNQIMEIPVTGFVNSLAFTSDGSKLIAAVGQEHRLGRWIRNKNAKNSILIISLKLNLS